MEIKIRKTQIPNQQSNNIHTFTNYTWWSAVPLRKSWTFIWFIWIDCVCPSKPPTWQENLKIKVCIATIHPTWGCMPLDKQLIAHVTVCAMVRTWYMGYGHPIIIREQENENRNCKESNPFFNSWRQVPPHLWELTLGLCAWFYVRGEPITHNWMRIKSGFYSCVICCAYYWSSNYSYGPYDAICFIENCHSINAN